MSRILNQSGSTTYLTLNDVATGVLAASPGPYTLSIWVKGGIAISSKVFVGVSSTSAFNTAANLYYFTGGSGQIVFRTIASGTGAQIVDTFTGGVWTLYVLVFTTATGLNAYNNSKFSVAGATYSSTFENFGTSVAIDNFTIGALLYNSVAAALHATNYSFSYMGLWSGVLSQANATLLATTAPQLVDVGNQVFTTDRNLFRATGYDTEFATVGSDVEFSSNNPELILPSSGRLAHRNVICRLAHRNLSGRRVA